MKKVVCFLLAFCILGVCFVGCSKNDEKIPHSIMAEFFVSPSGNDNNSGTKDSPFLTVEKAQAEVRKINQDMNGDIVVYLEDGLYTLYNTLTFDEKDSATNGFDIIYTAAENAKPVISGGTEISGFTLFDAEKNIYSAKVEEGFTFRQLYVNGEKAIRARSNTDYSTRIIGASRFDAKGNLIHENLFYDGEDALRPAAYGEIYINASEFQPFGNLEKVELHVLTAWVENILRIKSAEIKDGQVTIRVQEHEGRLVFNRMHPNIDGYSYAGTHDFVYYIENAYELIDTDNEWYLDESTNTLYFKAPSDMDMSTATVTAPRLETLVSVNTSDGSKMNNLTFDGITFEYSTWNYPSENGLVELQAGMYANYCIFSDNDNGGLRPAAGIHVANAHNFTVKNCIIQNMGAVGIDLNYGTDNSLIKDNIIRNISGNGIMIGKFVVDEKTDFHVAYNPQNKDEICTDDKIVNNYIHNIGTDYEGSVAIGAGYPKGILIANNEIAFAPYTGISVGYGWTSDDNAMSGNKILNNNIHHTSQVLCDAGGIYTLSKQPNSEMSGNYIHDIVLPEWADYATNGIYMDEQTSGYTVKNNVLENALGVGRNQNGENDYQEKSIYIDRERNDKIQKIIDNAGVINGVDYEIPSPPLPDGSQADIPQSFTLTTLFEDDFEGYEGGSFISVHWTVGEGQSDLVNIKEKSQNKYLEIDSNNENTKVNFNQSFGNNVTTFDFMFSKRLSESQGMYNVIRRSALDYTSNITPEFSTTARLESKGIAETGVHKDIKTKTWYTCKTMVYEGTMYMKIWERDKAEPAEWDVIRDMENAVNNDCTLALEFNAPAGKGVYVDNVTIELIS